MFESAYIDDALLMCFQPGPFSNVEWDRLLGQMRKKPITRVIAGSLGVNDPNGIQRKEGAAFLMEHKIQAVVVTDDRLVRGFVTAASWVGANISAFGWSDLRGAVERARIVDAEKANEAVKTLLFLRRTLERPPNVARKVG